MDRILEVRPQAEEEFGGRASLTSALPGMIEVSLLNIAVVGYLTRLMCCASQMVVDHGLMDKRVLGPQSVAVSGAISMSHYFTCRFYKELFTRSLNCLRLERCTVMV